MSRVQPDKLPVSKRDTVLSRNFGGAATKNKEEIKTTAQFITSYIKKANNEPTDAFGEIEFVGSSNSRTAKYVRVSSKTRVDILHQLLVKHWKLKTPNLVISVTGGAKNFTMRPRLKEVFRRSLIKASENTGAWITTGGTHAGVMKHVGKAVKNYAAIRDDKDMVVTVGIAPWGVIYGNEKLINLPGSNSKPKIYDLDERQQKNKTVLDFNHSHFILVDDGSDGKYGTEIKFRTELESKIAEQKTHDGAEVLIVCVIVQGGPGSLKTVAESIGNKTPVVIVGGTGGCADILAAASTMHEKDLDENKMTELLTENGMDVGSAGITEWTKMVKKCIINPNLISVFDLDPNDTSRDLDIAILEALLKANSEEESQAHQQLQLAMAWNRSDIAKSHILTDDACIDKKQAADMFFHALRYNKAEFCKVFLDFGVDLKEFCTVGVMENLYKSISKDNVLYKQLNRKKEFSLSKLGGVLIDCFGQSYISVYKRRKPGTKKYTAICCENEDTANDNKLQLPWHSMSTMEDPYREIFQWAIIANYREIARYVWEYMFGPMAAAIVATKILKSFVSRTTDYEKKAQFQADAEEYERLAVGVLAKCFGENVEKTMPLLIARLPKWGGYTCLHIATEANDKLFVASPGVQFFFDKVWMSKLSDTTSTFHIIAAGVFAPLIWITIKFNEIEKDSDDEQNGVSSTVASDDIEMQSTTSLSDGSQSGFAERFNNPELDLSPVDKPLTAVDKFIYFYDAPIVTFWLNVIFFLAYLLLFSFIILSNFDPTTVYVSVFEYVLVGWTATFVFEEFRELADEEARYLGEKIYLHITDPWNIMDLSSLTLFYVAFGLRWFPSQLSNALIIYVISFMIQCVRVVHIFAVHHILGPKIIMVGKMLKDLLFFLFILIVFLFSYGVASQALLYPGEKSFANIFVGVFYKPYWQIYGELFLDEINYDANLDQYTCSDTDDNLPRCPQQSIVVPIISALYLLLANVLLLNLLIAMFSYTFDKIESKGCEIWMFQRYKLITDYYYRPPLPPPFIIISHIYLLLRFIKRKIQYRERDDPFFHALKDNISDDEHKQLRQWERWHTQEFLQEIRNEDRSKVEKQMERLNDRIDNIVSSLEDMQDRLTVKSGEGKSITRLNNTMVMRFHHLEKMIEKVHAVGGIKSPPLQQKSVSFPARPSESIVEEPPQTSTKVIQVQSAKSRIIDLKKEPLPTDLHTKSRSSPYPSSNIKRTSVPDEKVMWKVEWPKYRPVKYTAPTVHKNPSWADKDLEEHNTESRPILPFNKYDQTNKVNRSSYMGNYMVFEGIPRNPKGRTGISGRGLLGRYGPNHAADPVITRWQRDRYKQIIKIDEKPVLEFVAVKRIGSGEWAIPGGMVDPGEHVSATLKREFSEEALNIDGSDENEVENIKHNVQILFNSGGLELFRGYCDDDRNTDNAWIETVACNFHDEEGTAFDHIKLNPGEEANKVSWKKVDHKLELFASHFEILKKAAEMHNAYF